MVRAAFRETADYPGRWPAPSRLARFSFSRLGAQQLHAAAADIDNLEFNLVSIRH
jgi:hypothetical protein